MVNACPAFPSIFSDNQIEFGVAWSLDCMYEMPSLLSLLHQPVIVSMCHLTERPSSPIMFLKKKLHERGSFQKFSHLSMNQPIPAKYRVTF
jgi:hypothetical protein